MSLSFVLLYTQTLTKIDEDEDDDDGDITFTSLQPLQVYCVLVKVESIASDASNISPVHCIKLPTGNVTNRRLFFRHPQGLAEMLWCFGSLNTYLVYP